MLLIIFLWSYLLSVYLLWCSVYLYLFAQIFFYLVDFFPNYLVLRVPYICLIQILYSICHLQNIFFLVCGLSSHYVDSASWRAHMFIILMKSNLLLFLLCILLLMLYVRNFCLTQGHEYFLLWFLPAVLQFEVLHLYLWSIMN